jgi:hypothetical protein
LVESLDHRPGASGELSVGSGREPVVPRRVERRERQLREVSWLALVPWPLVPQQALSVEGEAS